MLLLAVVASVDITVILRSVPHACAAGDDDIEAVRDSMFHMTAVKVATIGGQRPHRDPQFWQGAGGAFSGRRAR